MSRISLNYLVLTFRKLNLYHDCREKISRTFGISTELLVSVQTFHRHLLTIGESIILASNLWAFVGRLKYILINFKRQASPLFKSSCECRTSLTVWKQILQGKHFMFYVLWSLKYQFQCKYLTIYDFRPE